MIEEGNSRGNFSFAAAIKRKFYLDLSFLRVSSD